MLIKSIKSRPEIKKRLHEEKFLILFKRTLVHVRYFHMHKHVSQNKKKKRINISQMYFLSFRKIYGKKTYEQIFCSLVF